MCELDQVDQPQISFTALNTADVIAMEIGALR